MVQRPGDSAQSTSVWPVGPNTCASRSTLTDEFTTPLASADTPRPYSEPQPPNAKSTSDGHCRSASGAFGANPSPCTCTMSPSPRPSDGVTANVGGGGSGTDGSNASGAVPEGPPAACTTTAHAPTADAQSKRWLSTRRARRTVRPTATAPVGSAWPPVP